MEIPKNRKYKNHTSLYLFTFLLCMVLYFQLLERDLLELKGILHPLQLGITIHIRNTQYLQQHIQLPTQEISLQWTSATMTSCYQVTASCATHWRQFGKHHSMHSCTYSKSIPWKRHLCAKINYDLWGLWMGCLKSLLPNLALFHHRIAAPEEHYFQGRLDIIQSILQSRLQLN